MFRHFPFVILEIEADDLGRASAFYAAVFGWTFAADPGEHGAVEAAMAGDRHTVVRVHLRQRDPAAAPQVAMGDARHRHGPVLCVHELAPILSKVVQAGGKLIAGPVDVAGLGQRLYFLDSEGNEVSVLEPIRVP